METSSFICSLPWQLIFLESSSSCQTTWQNGFQSNKKWVVAFTRRRQGLSQAWWSRHDAASHESCLPIADKPAPWETQPREVIHHRSMRSMKITMLGRRRSGKTWLYRRLVDGVNPAEIEDEGSQSQEEHPSGTAVKAPYEPDFKGALNQSAAPHAPPLYPLVCSTPGVPCGP